ncbi:hypothetical protein [Kordia sp.]|uniref:hypothetical protein n=1 Tax=Kordia sp. TaxID=1965332 RepID=UPI003D6AA65E
MKKIASMLLLLIFVFSCQKESIQNEEELATEQINTEITPKDFSASNDNYSPREIMEINLRWTAYIAGSVLRNSPEAQNQVAILLQNGNTVIHLAALLENDTAFANKFREFASLYFILGNPNHDKTRPNPPPQGNPINLTNIFIDYILNENCIELYFPKSMDYTGAYNITTTGHPMNAIDDFNDGIIRYYSPIMVNVNGSLLYSTTHEVTVNDAYVQNNDNIIIARPYRSVHNVIGGPDCFYLQYDDIERFTDFLDY